MVLFYVKAVNNCSELLEYFSPENLVREGLGTRACERAFLMYEKRNPTHNR